MTPCKHIVIKSLVNIHCSFCNQGLFLISFSMEEVHDDFLKRKTDHQEFIGRPLKLKHTIYSTKSGNQYEAF